MAEVVGCSCMLFAVVIFCLMETFIHADKRPDRIFADNDTMWCLLPPDSDRFISRLCTINYILSGLFSDKIAYIFLSYVALFLHFLLPFIVNIYALDLYCILDRPSGVQNPRLFTVYPISAAKESFSSLFWLKTLGHKYILPKGKRNTTQKVKFDVDWIYWV